MKGNARLGWCGFVNDAAIDGIDVLGFVCPRGIVNDACTQQEGRHVAGDGAMALPDWTATGLLEAGFVLFPAVFSASIAGFIAPLTLHAMLFKEFLAVHCAAS